MARRTKGQGTIQKRKDGSYLIRLSKGKKENGKPNVKTRVARTRKEAEQKLKELQKIFSQEERRANIDFNELTTPEYFEKFLKYKSRNLTDKSLNRLESTINTHIIPYFDMTFFSQITSDKIQDRLDTMYEDNYSHSSIKKVHDAFNACFSWAVNIQQDILPEDNPMSRVEMISEKKFQKRKIRSFTKSEKENFIDEALRKFSTGTYVHPMGPVFVFMLNTGIREGEMCAIDRIADIEENILSIRNNAITIRNKNYEPNSRTEKKWTTIISPYGTKTPEGQRTIPLNNTAQKMLNEIKSIFPQVAQHNLLIYTGAEKPFPPANMVKSFKTICKAAGITNIEGHGPHVLRHTFATSLFAAEFDVKIISTLLGHRDVTVTQNIYIDVIKEQKVKAVEMIEI